MAKKNVKQLEADMERYAKLLAEAKAKKQELQKAEVAKIEKRFGKVCVSVFGANFLLEKSDEELNKFLEQFEADLKEYEIHDSEANSDEIASASEDLEDEIEDDSDDLSDDEDDVAAIESKNLHASYNPASNSNFGL